MCKKFKKFGKLKAPGSGSAPKVCGVKTKSASECVNSVNDVNICDSVDENVGDFMYMDVLVKGTKVATLLDTGSSINIISKSLYEKLPSQNKSSFRSCGEQAVKLANNQFGRVFSTASILMQTPCSPTEHSILYIF